MNNETDWYVYRGQQRWGPYTWQQMVGMVQQGNITPKDQVWHPQYPGLVNANQVPGLFQTTKSSNSTASSVAQSGNQLQCPNCGGYKVTSGEKPVIKKVPVPTWQRLAWGLLGLGLLGLAFFLNMVIDFNSDGALQTWLYCGCPGIVLTLVALFQSTSMKKVGKYWAFSCLLCGYRWEWSEGQPWPKVKVNSDLIVKGAQRLEEEEREAEEERKRQEALYHLSRLGKK